MIPERLVVVRRYLYRQLAAGDEELLSRDGIAAYLKRINSQEVELRVTERDAARAQRLLESSPQLVEEWRDPIECPNCRSADPAPRPPYVLMGAAIGFIFSAVLIARDYSADGAAVALLTVAAGFVLWPRVARWQCRACRATYATPRAR
jgi:hypothetical protein